MLTANQIRKLSGVNLKGYGGKEGILSSILSKMDGWERSSHKLYDYRNDMLGCLVECKKQANIQWLDPSKYNNLSREEGDISFLFIVVDKKGFVELVFSVRTGDLIDRFWSKDHVRDAYEYICKYPKDQIKSSMKTRKFYAENRDIVTTIYERKAYSLVA
jgi:hypothetical protein